MKLPLVNGTTMPAKNFRQTGGEPLSIAQQVLSDLGWQDLRPAIKIAEQLDLKIANQLKTALEIYQKNPKKLSKQRLQAALDKAIDKLQADYHRATDLKMQASQRREQQQSQKPASYSHRLTRWMLNSMQRFFDSDDASLVTRYDQAARSRKNSIAALQRYRRELAGVQESKLLSESSTAMSSVINSSEFIISTGPYDLEPKAKSLVGDRIVTAWTRYDDLNSQPITDADVYQAVFSTEGAPLVNQTRVNTYTQGIQFAPAIATFCDKTYIIVWASKGQDGDGYGIFWRRFAADGSPLNGETQANTYTAGDQSMPDVTVQSDGSFVLVWQSGQPGSSTYTVYMRRYNPEGAPLGPEVQVNTDSIIFFPPYNNLIPQPVVSALKSDTPVVAWQDYTSTLRVQGRIFPRDSFYRKNQFCLAGCDTNSFRYNPKIVALEDGGFSLVTGGNTKYGQDYSIYLQTYDEDGDKHYSEHQLDTDLSSGGYTPAATLSDGDTVLTTWYGASPQNSSNFNIYMQPYSVTDLKLGLRRQINTQVTGLRGYPDICALNGKGYVIPWTEVLFAGGDVEKTYNVGQIFLDINATSSSNCYQGSPIPIWLLLIIGSGVGVCALAGLCCYLKRVCRSNTSTHRIRQQPALPPILPPDVIPQRVFETGHRGSSVNQERSSLVEMHGHRSSIEPVRSPTVMGRNSSTFFQSPSTNQSGFQIKPSAPSASYP